MTRTLARGVCDVLAQRSRPQLFSNALPPTVACSALEAVRVRHSDPSLPERLRANAAFFRAGLREAGFKPLDGEAGIIPIIVGETAFAPMRPLFQSPMAVRWAIDRIVHFDPGDFVKAGFVHFGFHDRSGRRYGCEHRRQFLALVGEGDQVESTVAVIRPLDSTARSLFHSTKRGTHSWAIGSTTSSG